MRTKNNLNIKERNHHATWNFTLDRNPNYTLRQVRNMRCRDGVLKSGISYEWVTSEEGEKRKFSVENLAKVFEVPYYDKNTHSYKTRYGGVSGDGQVYFQKSDTLGLEVLARDFDRPALLYYTAPDQTIWTLVVGGKAVRIYGNGQVQTFSQSNLLSCACFYKHRLFLAKENNVLLYSAPEDIVNFEQSLGDGGSIAFPNAGGKIVGLKTAQEGVYVFFERGILRLDSKGNPKDFASETIEYSGGSIFGHTICVCGESIFFMAADGAYRLHGKRVEGLFPDFVQLPVGENGQESCASLQDRVFIRYEMGEGEKTLVLSADGKDCYYVDDLAALSYVEKGNALFLDKDYGICRLTDGGDMGMENQFVVETDFGISGYKTLRKLHFEGEGSFTLTVEADKRIRSYEITMENGAADIALSMRGGNFMLSFVALDKVAIRKMTAGLKTIG